MSFTEKQALEQWCPHAVASHTNPRQGFEVSEIGPAIPPIKTFPCIGSKCMAWRWSRARETKAYLDEVQRFMAETGENFNTATNKIYAKLGSKFERTEGYCGLAGRPE